MTETSHGARRRAFLAGQAGLAAAAVALPARALEACAPPALPLPPTISAGWPKLFGELASFPKPVLPAPDDIAGWEALRLRLLDMFTAMNRERVAATGVKVRADTLGGVPVLWVEPPRLRRRDSLVVYIHGGAYTLGSAASTLLPAAQMALATGRRVVSIDYTTAPRSQWDNTTAQVEKVFVAIYGAGYQPRRVACFGDSAGGGLLAGALLRMRDHRVRLPAAAALWSPWTDLDFQGDTMRTLAGADPIVSLESLRPSRDAYVAEACRRHPYVSPVYGSYGADFTPTLIQCGSREVLLSDAVRLYQAMDAGGARVQLDAYEGMPHVHQTMADQSPEAQRAIAKTVRFLLSHTDA
ncbi:alpha/beta hydrolase fold domain-containing protein [Rugamonas apoptosis]|uniref:Alpha/beta hydrolase n=1 Tax=Rugamonas apoptosis TaxID=2758570 RepID=A0A7W2FBN2_9BURK|nr:alpha/beta hydrolase [Rugamonas apoptosis]MBA5688664.1 alpha/beta hydrolase [Rugamonas apoptosis]